MKNKALPEEKLVPPDLNRCQCIKQEVNPWAFGIAPPKQCENKPTVIIQEHKKPYGSMSLCDDCLKTAKKQLGKSITVKKLVRSEHNMTPISVFTVVAETTEGAFIEGSYLEQPSAKQRVKEVIDPDGDVAYAKSEVSIHETTLWLPEELCLILSQNYSDGRKDGIPEGICFSDKAALAHIKKMLKNTDITKGSVYEKEELSYKKVPIL